MDELNLTSEDVAIAVDRSPSTVRNWYENSINWGLREKHEWERLANVLQWSLLDILLAHGYPISSEYPPEIALFVAKLQTLSPNKQKTALKFANTAVELFLSDESITDEDLE